jgi:hydrogenase maturation protease
VSDEARLTREKPTGLLVLGLGNVLLGDDGLGAVALARIESGYVIPEGVRLEDGGTLGLGLLGLLAEAERVILVDAVRTDSSPGTLVRLDGDHVMPAVRDRLSPHQVGVAELLDTARLIGCYPATVTLIGLVPESLDLGLARSPAVAASLDKLVEAIVREVVALGYPMVPQTRSLPGANCSLAGRFGM